MNKLDTSLRAKRKLKEAKDLLLKAGALLDGAYAAHLNATTKKAA